MRGHIRERTLAEILNGRLLSKEIQIGLKAEVAALTSGGARPPGLGLILVGADPASQIYVRNKGRACKRVGIESQDHLLPDSTTIDELMALIHSLNADPLIDGILCQLPLPKALAPFEAQVIQAIDPSKDVDCFHPENVGLLAMGRPRFMPATPGGILNMLDRWDIDVSGMDAVVIGRSNIVGKPMATLLTARNATVTLCHSRTRDLESHVRRADLIVAAIGRMEFVPGEWVKEGAVVIDVGINRGEDGLKGDVDFTGAEARARAITPVPGGVGPTTIATLLQNTVKAWKSREGISSP